MLFGNRIFADRQVFVVISYGRPRKLMQKKSVAAAEYLKMWKRFWLMASGWENSEALNQKEQPTLPRGSQTDVGIQGDQGRP